MRWTSLLRQADPTAIFEYEYFSERRADHPAATLDPSERPVMGQDPIPEPASETPEALVADARWDPPSRPGLKRAGLWGAAAAALLMVGLLATTLGSHAPSRSSPSSLSTPTPEPATAPAPGAGAPATTNPAAGVSAPLAPSPPVATPAPPAAVPTAPLALAPLSTPPPSATTSSPPPPPRQVLAQDAATGISQTTTFVAPANWDVNWTYDCSRQGSPGDFDFSGYTSQGGATGIYGPEQFGMRGSGVQHYTEAGTFHLVVNSSCSWGIQVVG